MEKEYYYIVNEKYKVVCEYYCTRQEAETLARISGCTLHSNFPYEAYGYEDPYNFIAEWSVYSDDNSRLYVQLNCDNKVSVVEGV